MAEKPNHRRERADAVVSLAEKMRKSAQQRGTDPVDDFLDMRKKYEGNEQALDMLTACIEYLRADIDLGPRGTGPAGMGL